MRRTAEIAPNAGSDETHKDRVKILKGERDLTECRRLVDAAQDYRNKRNLDDTWRRMVKLYQGKHWNTMDGEDRAVVNNIFSTINVIFPAISNNHPKITVNSRDPEHVRPALTAEAVINYWWRHYDFQAPVRRAVKDELITGFGWLKVYWQYEPAPEGRPDAPLDHPCVTRVSPHDVFVDPDATSMGDLKWIAHRFHRPLAAVKEDVSYTQQARDGLEAADITADRRSQPNDRERSPERMAVLWEFWDVEHNSLSVFSEDGEFFLRAPEPSPYPFRHPFVMLRNYDVPDEFYPIGDVEQLEALNMELNLARTQRMNHRKRYARKYVYRDNGSLENDSLKALTSDRDGELVRVNGTEPFGELVRAIDTPGLPPEFYNDTIGIQSDMDLVSGVTEYQRGGGGEIRRSATEASIIADSSNARVADKLATVEMAEARVGRMVVQLAQQFLTGKHVARLLRPRSSGDDSAQQEWEEFTAESISGEFDFEVEAGSTQPKNEQQRKQQAIEMLNALSPYIDRGLVDPYKPLEHVLLNGWGVRNPSEWLKLPSEQQPQQPQPEQPQGGQPSPNPQDEIPGREPVNMGVDMGQAGDGLVKGVPQRLVNQLRSQVPGFNP